MKTFNSKDNCIVFVTHKMDAEIVDYLHYLKGKADGIMELLVLYDYSTCPIKKEEYPDFNFHLFDSCHMTGFFHREEKCLPNPLVALHECVMKHEYKHYLVMENDIILKGDFRLFLEKVNQESRTDYIHIASDVEGCIEKHWPIRSITDSPFEHLYFSWSQLFYVSRSFLDELHKFMQSNDSFYYEFLLPTLAYNDRRFVVRQFENYGYQFQLSWGPTELYEYKYRQERMENTFYHPIKNLSIVDFL